MCELSTELLAKHEDTLGFQLGDVSLDPGKLQRLKPMPIQEKSPPPLQLSCQAELQRCKPSARMLATAQVLSGKKGLWRARAWDPNMLGGGESEILTHLGVGV